MVGGLPTFWAVLLVVAAAVSLAFVVWGGRRRKLHRTAKVGGLLFRAGLIAVGLVYAAGLALRSRPALLGALALAAAGAVLHLAGGLQGRGDGPEREQRSEREG
jgi:hypothetical protein